MVIIESANRTMIISKANLTLVPFDHGAGRPAYFDHGEVAAPVEAAPPTLSPLVEVFSRFPG